MLLLNFNLDARTVSIVHNHQEIIFIKQFSYPVSYHNSQYSYGWGGVNSAQEILTILTKGKKIYANYLGQVHFVGVGSSLPLTLEQNILKHNMVTEYKCVAPQKLGDSLSVTIQKNNQDTTVLLNLSQANELIINVIFFYSPEYLKTYPNLDLLKTDNTNLCNITAALFSNSCVPNYVVKVVNVGNFKVRGLEEFATCVDTPALEALLEDYATGALPQLVQIKVKRKANVVVFQVKYCDTNVAIFGLAHIINFQQPLEACLGITRTDNSAPNLNTNLDPIILAHEIGHLLGCSHSLLPHEQPEARLTPGYGHSVFDANNVACNGTIMSEMKHPITYFSNPNLFKYPAPYQNIPCGVAGVAEAYKVISNNLPRLAASI